jgi:hypothetical protein
MSKLVAFAAIQGAYNIVSKGEGTLKKAIEKYGPIKRSSFLIPLITYRSFTPSWVSR